MSTQEKSNSTAIGTFELVAAMVLSGTIGVFVVESGAEPFTVVFFRCVFGAIALGLYCAARGFFTDHHFTKEKVALAALGGVFIVFNWAFLFESYSRTSITVATVVYHTQPFYVVLLGALMFGDRITKAKIFWIVTAFLGLVMVSGVLQDQGAAGQGSYLLGLGFALAAAVLYALATVIAKKLTGVRPHLTVLIQVLVGIPLLAPFVTWNGVGSLDTSAWAWLLGLGVIHTCVMYILMYSSYQKLPTPAIAVLSFIYPAVAVIVDYLVYGTRISPLQGLGIMLIIGASLSMNLGVGSKAARLRLPRPVAGPSPCER